VKKLAELTDLEKEAPLAHSLTAEPEGKGDETGFAKIGGPGIAISAVVQGKKDQVLNRRLAA